MVTMKFPDLHEVYKPELLASILQSSALLPPDGVKSNLANPPNTTSGAIASMAICLVLGVIFFGMRLRARLLNNPWYFWTRTEDILSVIGFIVYIALVAAAFNMASRVGMFIHEWDIRVSDLASHLYMYHVITNLYGVAMLCVKSAIFLEWTRIFVPSNSHNVDWWLLRILFGINAIFYVTFMFTTNLDCIPYQLNWDHTIGGECWDSRPFTIASGIVNLVTDLGIVLIPQIIIWRLHLTLMRRASLSAVFSVGFLAVISTIVRLDAAVQNSMTNDSTWWNAKIITWTVTELSCLFIILSTPSVPQFWSNSHIAEFCKGTVGALSRRSLPMFRESQIIQLETDKTDTERQAEEGGNLTFEQAIRMPSPLASRSPSTVRTARFSPVPTIRYAATVKSERAASLKTWRQSSLKPARSERPTTAQTERPASAKPWRHSDMPSDIHPLLRTERHASMPQATVLRRHFSLQTPKQMSIKRKELPLRARPSLLMKPPKAVIVRKAVPSYAALEQTAAGSASDEAGSSCVAEEYV